MQLLCHPSATQDRDAALCEKTRITNKAWPVVAVDCMSFLADFPGRCPFFVGGQPLVLTNSHVEKWKLTGDDSNSALSWLCLT